LKDPYFKRLCSVDRKPFWNIFKSISSSADFRDLFESLTRREPDERPGLLHILKHPWLSTEDGLSQEQLQGEIISRYSIIEKAINSKQKEKVEKSSSYEDSSSSIDMIIKDHEDFEILRISAADEIS
jgi:serine/threonine protein kinase